ncbi:MAG: hypothetical protein QXK80_03205 [Candidatus Pacearchaeota archaeon]
MKHICMKRGIEWEVVAWIIAIIVLAFLFALAILLKKQGSNLIEWIKDFIRFGR